MATVVGLTGASPASAAENIEYKFVFADGGTGTLPGRGVDSVEGGAGRTITGVATSNDFNVTVDGKAMTLKMNCDDLYNLYGSKYGFDPLARDGSNTNWGWGTKKDPKESDATDFRVWDFFIYDHGGSFCGNTAFAADLGITLPVIYGPGDYQWQFVFAVNDDTDGSANGPGIIITGSSSTNSPTVHLPQELCGAGAPAGGCDVTMHVSCSDNFHLYASDDKTLLLRDATNPLWGYGEKDAPQPPQRRLWDYRIFKLSQSKNCGAAEINPGEPAIDIQKTPDLQELVGGGLVEFTITVTNVGDVDLTDTVVTDVEAPDCERSALEVESETSSLGGSVGSILSPGEWFSYTCLLELADEVVNVAAVSAMWEAQEVTDEDDAVVEVAEIEITKTLLTPSPLVGGGIVQFEIHVENIGHVRLRVTRVLDSKMPACARSASEVRALPNDQGGTVGIRFTPGESFTYTCADEIGVGFTNTATARARTEVFRWWLQDQDSAVVEVVNPNIEIAKSAAPIGGGLWQFTITVTNTGDQRLKDTAVTDPLVATCARTIAQVKALPNNNSPTPGIVGLLLTPGESFTYTCLDEPASDFTNVAFVTAVTEDDVYPVGDSDTAFVDVP